MQSFAAGDIVLLTGGVAIAGTSDIATALAHRLQSRLSDAEIRQAATLRHRLGTDTSEHQRIIRTQAGHGLRAIIAVSDGGVGRTLHQLASRIGPDLGIAVDPGRIPLHQITARVFDVVRANPLGARGHGSVIAILAPTVARAVLDGLEAASIVGAQIGVLTPEHDDVRLQMGGTTRHVSPYDMDEVERVVQHPASDSATDSDAVD